MINTCQYTGNRHNAIVEYLYGDLDGNALAVFEAHLLECMECRNEVNELRGVRTQLAMWSPPAADALLAPPAAAVAAGRWWRDVPAWLQVAAAMLSIGVAAGAANLRIQYGHDGVNVSTGWMRTPGDAAPRSEAAGGREVRPVGSPWRADLEVLEQRLRTEFHASLDTAPHTATVASAGDDTLKKMKTLVSDSERKQQRELALRVAEVFRDVQAQRQTDLAKIDRTLSVLQNNTGVEVMRQRQLINSLAVRVSQRQ